MDTELIEALKELLVIIDEFRIIDDPEIERRLKLDTLSPSEGGMFYSTDFVDTYELIRTCLVEMGHLPQSPVVLPPYEP